MARLNYAGRKSTGAKLGGIVKKDVLRHNQSSLNSKKSAAKDPHVEINLAAKDLGDEGLKLVCDGLVEALQAGGVRLDELSLAENHITMEGLPFLSKVVKLAGRDLKDLDLHGNDLKIVSTAHSKDWEGFLESFKDVRSLRRLDISENELGDRAFELLWKVYTREPPLHFPRDHKGPGSLPSAHDSDSDDTDGQESEGTTDGDEIIYERARNLSISDRSPSVSSSVSTPPKAADGFSHGTASRSQATSPISTRTDLCGLRSVPYIICSNVCVTDAAALFLSYIIAVHPSPERLMAYLPHPKPGSQTDILETYNSSNGCCGIICRPNKDFSCAGDRLLECAQTVRTSSVQTNGHRRRISETPLSSPMASMRSRRESRDFSSILLSPLEHLDKARNKVQGLILRDNGLHHVELWSVAIQILALSRTIFFDPEFDPSMNIEDNPSPTRLSPRSITFSNNGDHKEPPSPIVIKNDDDHLYTSPQQSPMIRPSSAPVAHEDWPPILPATSMSIPSRRHFNKPPPIKKDHGLPSPLATPSPPKPHPEEMHIYKQKLLGDLPKELWQRIIALAVDPQGLLSNRQVSSIVKWSHMRSTLEKERELAGKMKNQQQWRVLEGLQCLVYDP